MEVRFQQSPKETKGMTTEALRANFLAEKLMQDDQLRLLYSHYDRVIIGGAKPVMQTLSLNTHPELRADYFLDRRELGIINVGGSGIVEVEQEQFALDKLDCLYIGRGIKSVLFKSIDAANPAIFYLLSAPAHHSYPTQKLTREEAMPATVGAAATSNN